MTVEAPQKIANAYRISGLIKIYGEGQRVAIARAVAKQPTVMFCDEPTGAGQCNGTCRTQGSERR